MFAGTGWYLALPFAASLLFALGLIVVKKANQAGAPTHAVTLATNLWTAALFAGLWFTEDVQNVPWQDLWQPVLVALLFLGGQICTFRAVERGDVSVASPILSVKVFLVAVFLVSVADRPVPGRIWLAAAAAAAGVALIQSGGGRSHRGSVTAAVAYALASAAFFALFDVLVQMWAPRWGVGRFLPIVFGLAGAMSLGWLPWIDMRSLRHARPKTLQVGSLLIALQSLLIVFAIARFGDAARINVVYSLRGIWGVALAWAFARWLGGGELHLPRRTMAMRLAGAVLVTIAVIAAIGNGRG